MSDLDVQLKYKNKNGGYDNLYPRTKGEIVQMNDGRNAEQVLDEVTDLYNQVIEDGTISDVNSAPEIIASRVDSKGATHPTLKSRLDHFEVSTTAQLQQTNVKTKQLINITMEPYNAVAGEDITDILNTAINDMNLIGGGTVYIPPNNTSYLIDAVIGIQLKNNVTLLMEQNTKLKAIANNADNYIMLNIENKQNVNILNGQIIGDRETHTGTTGEWGHGISVTGSTNITIQNTSVADCWGDGLYISAGTKNYCENVLIENFSANNNRRQGISVVSVKNLTMNNLVLTNTKGTPPAAGIDFEPNQNTHLLEGIRVTDVYTANNEIGITVNIHRLLGSNKKHVDITITNHTDDGSTNAFIVTRLNKLGVISGHVTTLNPIWKNTVRGVSHLNWSADHNAYVIIINPTIIDSNTANNASMSGYSTFIVTNSENVYTLGNIKIKNPNIYSVNGFLAPQNFYFNSDNSIQNVQIIDPISVTDDGLRVGVLDGIEVTDKNNILTKELTVLNNDLGFIYHSLYKNTQALNDTVLRLQTGFVNNSSPFTVRCTNQTHDMLVSVQTGVKIQPLGLVDQRLRLKTGTSVTLQRVNTTTYQVINSVGTIIAE